MFAEPFQRTKIKICSIFLPGRTFKAAQRPHFFFFFVHPALTLPTVVNLWFLPPLLIELSGSTEGGIAEASFPSLSTTSQEAQYLCVCVSRTSPQMSHQRRCRSRGDAKKRGRERKKMADAAVINTLLGVLIHTSWPSLRGWRRAIRTAEEKRRRASELIVATYEHLLLLLLTFKLQKHSSRLLSGCGEGVSGWLRECGSSATF